MSCFYPVKIWVLSPQYRQPGTPSVIHNDLKIPKKYLDRYFPKVRPCGVCIECKLRKSAYVATRCVHEASMHSENSFLTLTYSDENLPRPYNDLKKDGSVVIRPALSLVTSDMQDFWKRYRIHLVRNQIPAQIKYYASGEYAPETLRPHYHACVFGHAFPDKEYYKKTDTGDVLYTSATLTKIWGHGHAVFGDVSFESAAYVARYTLKKIYGDDADEYYQGRLPEKSWSSQGLAEAWFQKFASDVYPSDEIILYGGRRLAPPPYYDKLLLKYNPSLWEDVQNKRAEKIIIQKNNFTLDRYVENGNPRVRTVSDTVRRAQLRVGSLDNKR